VDLFTINDGKIASVKASRVDKERVLQALIEANLLEAFRIRFLASEYSTGEKHAGRIDTLGIDENGTPVVIEYKRSADANVVMQALYYLDWLVDHQAEFEKLVADKEGAEAIAKVDWSAPRVVCIAESYTKFDQHGVAQMGRDIELVEYTYYPDGYLVLNLVSGVVASSSALAPASKAGLPQEKNQKTATILEKLGAVRPWADEILEYASELGSDVTVRPHQVYVAIRTSKNFACLTGGKDSLSMTFHLDPKDPAIIGDCKNCRDVTSIGKWGTGDLQLFIKSNTDVVKAKELLDLAYATRTGGA
jgi:predicted transport protein